MQKFRQQIAQKNGTHEFRVFKEDSHRALPTRRKQAMLVNVLMKLNEFEIMQ